VSEKVPVTPPTPAQDCHQFAGYVVNPTGYLIQKYDPASGGGFQYS